MSNHGQSATIGGMPKPKQTAQPPQEPGSPVLYVRMPPKLQAAFERFLADDPTEPKRQDVGIDALVMFLTAKGYWPPPESKGK